MSAAIDIALTVIDILESHDWPYMLVGSFSSNQYAVPRSTKDIDFVIAVKDVDFDEVVEALHPHLTLDPQIRFETVLGTTRYIFNEIESDFRVEFFELSDDPHDTARFKRRRRVALEGRQTWAPAAEDVIIMKLRWGMNAYRLKDREDVENIVLVQADKLDWPYIHQWCDRHGTRDLLEQIRSNLQERGLIDPP